MQWTSPSNPKFTSIGESIKWDWPNWFIFKPLYRSQKCDVENVGSVGGIGVEEVKSFARLGSDVESSNLPFFVGLDVIFFSRVILQEKCKV